MTRKEFCRPCVVALVFVVLSVPAIATVTAGNVQITAFPTISGNVTNASCPTGYNWCGKALIGGATWMKFSGQGNGFHDYTINTSGNYNSGPAGPGFDSQYWLQHNTNGPTISLCDSTALGAATNCFGQLVKSSAQHYHAPTDSRSTEDSYYLTTTDTTGTNPITMQFGTVTDLGNGAYSCTGCITAFAFYWGSMDTWNTVTLTDASGATFTYSPFNNACAGSVCVPATSCNSQYTVCTFDDWTTPVPALGSAVSYVVRFMLVNPNNHPYQWQTVSFSSTAPAFELDNLSWERSNNCAVFGQNPCLHAPTSNGQLTQSAPVPEPTGLVLFAIGLVGIAGAKRRQS